MAEGSAHRSRRNGHSLPDSRWKAAEGKPGKSGICLSGGGIRAAAYSLGALQAMQEHGLVTGDKKVDYLSAVSGGSYIASALTVIAAGAINAEDTADGVEVAHDPYARGTPEEQYLRNHTAYLVHGRGGRTAMVARLLGGIMLNLLFVGLAVHTIFRMAGWIYGWILPELRAKPAVVGPGGQAVQSHVNIHLATWTWATPTVIAGVGLFLALVALGVSVDSDRIRRFLLCAGWTLISIGAAFAIVCVGIPKLLELVRDVVARWGTTTTQSTSQLQAAKRSTEHLAVGGGAGAAGAIVTGLLALRARSSDPSVRKHAEQWFVRKISPLLPKLRSWGLNLLAAVFGPLLVVAGAVIALNLGAANTPFWREHPRWPELLVVGVSLALFTLMRYFADLNAWSMHAIYKRRLSDAFILRRVRAHPDEHVEAEPRIYSSPYRLSASQGSVTPTLLVCAAVNVSDYGRIATGADVAGFVFSADHIGGPLGGMKTTDYEQAVDAHIRSVTLPTAMSIAGAAISPSMGKMTRRPLRFLMALLNLRLGVWIPNPNRVGELVEREANRSKVRFPERPRMNYLLREMIGRNTADARFVYVSDGGHYENLGLVELLRRGCTTVWCVDASGEKLNSYATLAQAISLARSELGVDIDIDLREMGPDPAASGHEARYVRRTWVTGTIRYQNGVEGDIVVLKCGVPCDAPADVLSFHSGAPLFPCDPTTHQLYTAERFDAYRALGYFSARSALADAKGRNGSRLAGAWQPVGPAVPAVDLTVEKDRVLVE